MKKEHHDAHNDESMRLAPLSDRAVAFSIDYALFNAGYYLSLKLLFPDIPLSANPQAMLWFGLWAALFIIYQAYSSCEGRSSIGKSLLGLKVVSLEHAPLGLEAALIRSTAYLASSFLGAGFIWSMFNPTRRCWHDLAAGSIVVETRPKRAALRPLIQAGAFASLAIFGLSWMCENVWKPRFYQIKSVAYSQVGFSEISELQKVYRQKKGKYASSLLSLATVSPDPQNFLRDMAAVYDFDSGVKIKTNKVGYTVVARARDRERTLVTYTGS